MSELIVPVGFNQDAASSSLVTVDGVSTTEIDLEALDAGWKRRMWSVHNFGNMYVSWADTSGRSLSASPSGVTECGILLLARDITRWKATGRYMLFFYSAASTALLWEG